MCGICGIASHAMGTELSRTLMEMNDAITHRGPDDAGNFVNDLHGIAMRRLSIIDIAGGHQPIFNENGRYVIVFNGEIYNYRELYRKLILNNHQFQTQSDTETIIHLYEEEKENTPKFLKGMFAFCIYDTEESTLFIARDRFGEKPLYYFNHPQKGFVFSSEVKSLLACPFVPRIINLEALGYYLRLGYVPAPLTMLKDVHILPPGHWLKWQAGHIDIQSYYSIDYTPDPALDHESDAIASVLENMKQAVMRQSISDVPLGAFLSGGIDSSSIAAMLQATTNRSVKTFNVRFEEASYDESAIARQVAQHLGTEHHEFVVPNVGFEPDDLWRIVEHVGMPFLDTSAIPTYLLTKQIRQEVTVALSGDGGDEMFAGYPVFQWAYSIRQLKMLPQPVLSAGASVTNAFSRMPGFRQIPQLRRIRRGLESAVISEQLLPVSIQTVFEIDELKLLTNQPDVLAAATGNLPHYTDLPARAATWTPLRRLMYLRLKNNLHDDMLVKVDRMSMANSLEVRSPMLDVDLAELSMRLPDKHLIKGGIGKYILRQAMAPMLPEIVFSHPKTGFSIPLHTFQNDAYKSIARELLQSQQEIITLFDSRTLQNILDKGFYQKKDDAVHSVYRGSHQLWSIMQLAAWSQRFKVTLP